MPRSLRLEHGTGHTPGPFDPPHLSAAERDHLQTCYRTSVARGALDPRDRPVYTAEHPPHRLGPRFARLHASKNRELNDGRLHFLQRNREPREDLHEILAGQRLAGQKNLAGAAIMKPGIVSVRMRSR